MIRFELDTIDFALTNDQWAAATGVMGQDWTLDYDIVEGCDMRIELWVHHTEGNPTRIGIMADGQIAITEEVDWEWNPRNR